MWNYPLAFFSVGSPKQTLTGQSHNEKEKMKIVEKMRRFGDKLFK